MASRRAAFDAYYKANPDKLKGKTLDEAFSAMRREAARKGLKPGDLGGQNASDRKLAVARRLSRQNAGSNRHPDAVHWKAPNISVPTLSKEKTPAARAKDIFNRGVAKPTKGLRDWGRAHTEAAERAENRNRPALKAQSKPFESAIERRKRVKYAQSRNA